jgi:hypothetical protein
MTAVPGHFPGGDLGFRIRKPHSKIVFVSDPENLRSDGTVGANASSDGEGQLGGR